MNNHKLKQFFLDLFAYEPEEKYHFTLPETESETANEDTTFDDDNKTQELEPLSNIDEYLAFSLKDNLTYIKTKYNTLINSDVKIREFSLNIRNRQYNAFLVFIDGMVDSELINRFILHPLMLRNKANTFTGSVEEVTANSLKKNIKIQKKDKFDLTEYIFNCLLPQNDVEKATNFEEIIPKVNSGSCALFVDTINTCFVMDVKGFEKRSISPPQNELVIQGPQEAFIESIRTNTSLIRRGVNNENLVIEDISVGEVSKTKCSVCYIKGIANNELIAEVKYRINNLGIDYLLSSGHLEQLIVDHPNSTLPQILWTERPDTSVTYLLEGRVVVLVNGSPFSLVMPATFFDFLTSVEDSNLSYKFANMLRFLRVLAAFITLLLPGLYIAITTYHQELIPTELLSSIVASRSSVPFPIIFEIFLMEISFELIREAGLRAPSAIGSTIGIIGAIVLGDAAVSASIVSPILIIIVAITGLASFAIPNYSLSFHFRISRFIYTILGALGGFLGIAFGLFVYLAILCTIKSFGMPYLAPYVPVTDIRNSGYNSDPIWKKEKRSDALNTKRTRKQDHISMKWRQGGKA